MMCEAMWIVASAQSTSLPFIQILPVPGNPIAACSFVPSYNGAPGDDECDGDIARSKFPVPGSRFVFEFGVPGCGFRVANLALEPETGNLEPGTWTLLCLVTEGTL